MKLPDDYIFPIQVDTAQPTAKKKKKTTNIKDIFDRNSSVNTGIFWTAEKGKKHMLPYNAEPYFDVRHPVT